jgi:limonene-1,2-epoxide hydrolase
MDLAVNRPDPFERHLLEDESRMPFAVRRATENLRRLAPDVLFVDPTFHLRAEGREQMRPIVESGRAVFDALALEVRREIVSEPWIVVQQRQSGDFKVPGSTERRPMSVEGVSLYRIEGGWIREWWDYYDVDTYRRQVKGDADAR